MKATGETELTFEALTRGPALYTPAEVARLLRVHPRTVLNWIHEGHLDAVKVSPRVYRVMRGALVQVLFPDRIRRLPVRHGGRIPRPGQGERLGRAATVKVSA